MASFNKVLLMGNLTRDPEVRTTPSGLTIAKLGLAVNRKYRTREGEQKEETTFVDVDAFGPQAEVIQRYCSKGSGIFIEGRLRLDQWQDPKSGENRSKLNVVLENFQFTGGRGEGGNQGGGYEQSSPPRRESNSAQSGNSAGSQGLDEEDDVPF